MQEFQVVGFALVEISSDGIGENEIAYVRNESDARKWSAHNPFRTHRPVNFTVKIFDSLEEFEEERMGQIRIRALAKLSKEEKIALGLE